MSDCAAREPRLRGYFAEGDLSGKQHHFVKFGTKKNTITAITAATDTVVGILHDFRKDGTDGDSCDVALPGGGGFLKMAAALAPGAEVKTDATGQGVAAVVANDKVAAMLDALDGNTAAGDVVACEVTHPYRIHA